MANACPGLGAAAEAVLRRKDGCKFDTWRSVQEVRHVLAVGQARLIGNECHSLTCEHGELRGGQNFGASGDRSRRNVGNGRHAAQRSNNTEDEPELPPTGYATGYCGNARPRQPALGRLA